MVNAKEELISEFDGREVLCAIIGYGDSADSIEFCEKKIILKTGYSEKSFKAALKTLDFEYDSYHSPQSVCGTVWFTDGSWCERYIENGIAEFWVSYKTPEIPNYLKK